MKIITHLPFDSRLFGYPVGKAEIPGLWNEAEFLEEASNYQLVYILSKKPLSIVSPKIQAIENKIVFEKVLDASPKKDPEINLFEGLLFPELENLALESGIFSRFKMDLRLSTGEFEKLYKLWIQKSLNAKEVLISTGVTGFVSCHVNEGIGQIGLIAVDPNHRGKGWAKRLVQAAEDFAFSKGAQKMKIGTQDTNQPACSLYEKMGYKATERVWIGHYWRTIDSYLPNH